MGAIGRAAIEGRRRLPSRRNTAIAIDRRLKLAPANFSDRGRPPSRDKMTAMAKSRALFYRTTTYSLSIRRRIHYQSFS